MIHRSAPNLIRAVILALAAAVALPSAGLADPVLAVSNAWTRSGSPGANAAVYFTVENDGTSGDSLKSIETPVAAGAQIHTSVMDGNIVRMRRLDSVQIFPGERVPFEPAGLHIVLSGLKKTLAPGDFVPVTLIFEHAGPVQVQAEVRSPTAAAPASP